MLTKEIEAGEDFSIIPIDKDSEQNDIHYLFNIILNILIQTSPQRHYKLIPKRNIEMYNTIMS